MFRMDSSGSEEADVAHADYGQEQAKAIVRYYNIP